MKKKAFQLLHYIAYLLRAKNTHGVHSPFVFDFLNKVIYTPHSFYAYEEVETIREKMLHSEDHVHFIDMGAGALEKKNEARSVKNIARYSVKPSKYGQLLFRIANYFQPKNILELGTSLGITTSYLHAGCAEANIATIEGCPEVAVLAQKNWEALKYNNISLHVGNFDQVLPVLLKEAQQLDLVFFDGNHRKQATLHYFYKCLEKSHERSVFVLDDIYWSREMKEAWEEIKACEQVSVTVDLFFMGIVFFRKGQVKEDFVIRY